MVNESYLKIRDFGVIDDSKININKINVIGGVNSSGKTIVSKLLYCYLKSINGHDLIELMNSEDISNSRKNNIEVNIESYSDVFYLESISMLDLIDLKFMKSDHIKHIMDCLEVDNSNVSNEIITKIKDIIKTDCSNLSSAGIKQIGVIQILLENGSLKENSFLIIDEPESNLHPDWQIKFAEILVMLTKELDITLYLNSYSPIFIEAISLYAQFYGLLDKTSVYLTKKTDNGKFNFKKINPKNMGEIYENLTKPYDMLDKLKAQILFKE